MRGVVELYDHAMCGCVLVGSIVGLMLVVVVYSRYISLYVWQGHLLEVVWTVAPIVVLLFLAFPSLQLLYTMNETVGSKVSLKVVGHQWYWSYEYDYCKNAVYDSYMIPVSGLGEGGFRSLDVDYRAVIPFGVGVRALVTSADVLHSWAVPGLGVKMDAVPGRLNQIPIFASRPGVFYGQCSELCGAQHSFMPVVLEAVNIESYCKFIKYFDMLEG
uniref:Cytochrome c oxidase subunit 2 n=1 Tax=Cucullaea labiata TaxID=142556 RepID=A0A141AX71_9BIVA|nr:cytochrome c oxidase subunit II [Cucullaea labiata]